MIPHPVRRRSCNCADGHIGKRRLTPESQGGINVVITASIPFEASVTTLFSRSCALIAGFVLWSGAAMATTLITDDEAKRPIDPQVSATRGITRGPSILFEPPAATPAAHAPFDFKVRFEPHGGATIDPTHVKVTYLKVPAVDLTERLKPFLSANGIDMPAAQVPLGDHPLKIEIEDSDGRNSEATFTMKVGK
jgi:hypothetical protein